jgi:serine-type D-Ala-D-Ala carboxypeptidase/endopeptidase (penicillin-binding protein 4)
MQRHITVIALFVTFIFCTPFSSLSQKSNLQQRFERFASDTTLSNANWSLHVVNAHTGQTILAHNKTQSVVPASTQKLVTTATALLMLGSDFRYPTSILHSGMIDQEGTLHGDLIIKGSGDPTLGTTQMHDSLALEQVFDHWLRDIQRLGIRKITGTILADESVFDDEMVPRKWLWEDIGNYYGAGSSGLTVYENMYTVFFQPGNAVGKPVTVLGTEPHIPGMKLENQVTTGPRGSGDRVYIFGAPFNNHRVLTGTAPLGTNRFPVRGSMPDPPAFLAQSLDAFLSQNGIITSGQTLTFRQAMQINYPMVTRLEPVSTWHSPPLKEIAIRTNLNSNNTYAENLLKTIGYHQSGLGTVVSGVEALMAFWQDLGVPMQGMRLHDGSGLSPSNRLTTEQLASILSYCALHTVFHDLLEGLPVAGESGSLANHFNGTPSKGVLKAKSGFLGNVRSYAGYTTLPDGTLVAFAFIVNDYHGSPAAMREKMFRLMDAITAHDHSKP